MSFIDTPSSFKLRTPPPQPPPRRAISTIQTSGGNENRIHDVLKDDWAEWGSLLSRRSLKCLNDSLPEYSSSPTSQWGHCSSSKALSGSSCSRNSPHVGKRSVSPSLSCSHGGPKSRRPLLDEAVSHIHARVASSSPRSSFCVVGRRDLPPPGEWTNNEDDNNNNDDDDHHHHHHHHVFPPANAPNERFRGTGAEGSEPECGRFAELTAANDGNGSQMIRHPSRPSWEGNVVPFAPSFSSPTTSLRG